MIVFIAIGVVGLVAGLIAHRLERRNDSRRKLRLIKWEEEEM
jgi:hypothetical protein